MNQTDANSFVLNDISVFFSIISFEFVFYTFSPPHVWVDGHVICCFLDCLIKPASFRNRKLTLKFALLSHASCVFSHRMSVQCVCLIQCSKDNACRMSSRSGHMKHKSSHTRVLFKKISFVSSFQQNMCDLKGVVGVVRKGWRSLHSSSVSLKVFPSIVLPGSRSL